MTTNKETPAQYILRRCCEDLVQFRLEYGVTSTILSEARRISALEIVSMLKAWRKVARANINRLCALRTRSRIAVQDAKDSPN